MFALARDYIASKGKQGNRNSSNAIYAAEKGNLNAAQ